MFFDLEKFFVKRKDLCRASCARRGELILRVRQNLLEMTGCHDFDCRFGSSICKLRDTDQSKMRNQLIARWRIASFCYRGWDAECREAPLPFFCCRDTPPALEESCFARHRRGSAHRFAVERHALLVAAPWAVELRRAVFSHQSTPAATAPPLIQSRSAILGHYPARRNRVISEKHPAQWLVQVCRVAVQTALETRRSGAGYPAFAS